MEHFSDGMSVPTAFEVQTNFHVAVLLSRKVEWKKAKNRSKLDES